MSFKNEIKQDIKEVKDFNKGVNDILGDIKKQLDSVRDSIAQAQDVPDGEKDFANNQVITARALYDSLQQANMSEKGGNINDSVINEGNHEAMLWFWNHKIINDESFDILYYWELNKIVDWYISELSIYNEDDEMQEKAERAFRYAFLFTKIFSKDGNLYSFSGVENGMIKGVLLKDYYGSYSEFQDDLRTKTPVEFKIEEVAILNLWWDSIGFYTKGIQYLAPYIYYRRIREKNASFLHLIADTSTMGRKKPWWITMFNCFRIKDKSKDNQIIESKQNEALSGKITWYAPSEDAYKLLIANSTMIDKQWELVCNMCGMDVQAADNKQTLAQEANVYGSRGLNIKKNIIGRFYRWLKKDKELNGNANSEFEFIDDEISSDNKNYEGNDNATGGTVKIKENERKGNK